MSETDTELINEPLVIKETLTPIGKVGRPKGSKGKKTLRREKLINSIMEKPLKLMSPEEVASDGKFTLEQKLALLSNIAKNRKSSSRDVISAIDAHTSLSGESSDGYKRLIIKIVLDDTPPLEIKPVTPVDETVELVEPVETIETVEPVEEPVEQPIETVSENVEERFNLDLFEQDKETVI